MCHIYVYVYMCMCMCICVCVCVYVYTYMYTHISVFSVIFASNVYKYLPVIAQFTFTTDLSFDFHQTFTKAPMNFQKLNWSLIIVSSGTSLSFPFIRRNRLNFHLGFASLHQLPSLIRRLEPKIRSGQSCINNSPEFR